MSKRPIRGESSSTANKRQGVTAQDEDPLPSASASASSSLAQQVSPLSIPKIPLHLIADLILPFVADRTTWNSVHSASKDLRRSGKKMTPPWPNKVFNVGSDVNIRYLAFAPSGSQLAFCMNNSYTSQYVIYVWDRWGNETLLEGHTEYICCLKYSLDGEYLASGSEDESIRIWSRESCHATTSNPDSERPTRIPQQADKIILGSYPIMALSFSRTDSNLLASGGLHGDIKLWNATEQACIHSFESHGGPIRSLFFTGGADIACIAAAEDGSIIRLWKAEGTSDLASETFREADRGGNEICRAVFSPSGSFLAINFGSRTGNGSTVALYELETMTKTQSVIMPWFIPSHIAVTSDSKQLVVVGRRERIRLLQTDDLSIQRDFDPRKGMPNMPSALSVAFDPTCRVLAVGYRDGGLELRSL